jgi:cyclin B
MKNKNKEQIFNGDITINTNKSSKINKINKTQISFRVESQNLKIDRIDKKDINIENKENLNIKELSLKMNQSHTSRDRPINKLDRVSEIKGKETIIVNKSQSQIKNKYIKKEKKIKIFDISKIKDNIQIPKEYINKIYYNLLKEEDEGINPKPKYNYMKEQKEINEKMRSILIDWLIDVHHKFRFSDETLFMTVFIIDRYLSVNQITKLKLQLLGITSLLIACKHEEIDLPKIDDFIYITDNAYVKDEVIRMENYILKVLNFELLYPSPIKFYEYLSIYFNFDKKMHLMGKYLMESFLVDIKCTKYKPSIISSACCYIVLKFFKFKNYQESYDKKFYSLVIDDNSKYSEHDIKDCARDICLFVDNINKTKFLACQKKYSKPELEKVSILIMTN